MSQNSTRWSVVAYEHAIKIDGPDRTQPSTSPPDRQEGDIKGFSADSRRRLVKKILRLEKSRVGAGHFVTLTYHEEWTLDRQDLQSDLNAFLQALRRTYPQAKYLWRLEFQSRGAPHFHILLWRPAGAKDLEPNELAEWVAATWHRIAEPSSEDHAKWGTDTRRITSWREALAYVSKYLGKVGPEGEVEYSGRRWGASQSLPTSPTCRYHVSERDGQILRRILRKLVAKTLGEDHALVEHLKTGTTALIGCEPSTWMGLMDYIQDHGEQSIRAGPPPSVPSDVPDDAEWVRFTTNPAPSRDIEEPPAATLQCA